MAVSPDVQAYAGEYVSSNVQQAGSVTYTVTVPEAGSYVVWCRAIAPDSFHASFFVRMDGGTEDIFDVAYGTWGPNWQWSRVNGRDGTAVPGATGSVFNPIATF